MTTTTIKNDRYTKITVESINTLHFLKRNNVTYFRQIDASKLEICLDCNNAELAAILLSNTNYAYATTVAKINPYASSNNLLDIEYIN